MLTKIVNGEEVVLSAEEEAAIAAEWNANLIATTEEIRVKNIKEEADLRIALSIPDAVPPTDKMKVYEKELNYLMLNAELDNIVINGGILDASQQAQKNEFIALKDKIKDIRAMSNLAEANGDSLVTFQTALDLKEY